MLSLVLRGDQNSRAATRTWTGTAADDLWSLGGNWLGGGAPVDGDSVVFYLNTPRAARTARVDYDLSLDTFTFFNGADPNAITIGPPGAGGAGAAGVTLTLAGLGLANDPDPTGPTSSRQKFFINGAGAAGVAGSTMALANAATISGLQGVEITARGGMAAGAGGGNLLFRDHAVAVTPGSFGNPSSFFAEGGSVAGAAGGMITLRDDARFTAPATIFVNGGSAAVAGGGQLLVQDRARIDAINVLLNSGTNGGAGATAAFSGTSVFTGVLYAGLNGGGDGPLARFSGDARLEDGSAQIYAAMDPALAGGRLEFRDRATLSSTNSTPGFGVTISNFGGLGAGASGGRTDFYDDSAVTGPQVLITNSVGGNGPQAGSQAGETVFHDRASAGAANVFNQGAYVGGAGTTGGSTTFLDDSTAANASLRNLGGDSPGAPGGRTEFAGNANAARATLTANGGTNDGAGGLFVFSGNATGGTARVILDGNATLDISASTRASLPIGSLEGTGGVVNLGSRALEVGGNNLSTDFAGSIQGGGALVKSGTGALSLSGTSAFSGNATVAAGTLVVNGSVNTPLVTVVDKATLAGTGTIGGPVTVANGGIVAPGKTGAGVLSVGALTLNATSILNYQLGSLSDRIDVNGPLTLDGMVNVSALGGLTVGVYRLLNYSGAFTDNGLALGTFPAGTTASDFSIQTNVAGQVNLVLNGGAGDLLFWDGPNSFSNSVVNGGTGTWTNSATNWTNSGGTLNQAWASQKAVFTGVAGTVTLGENVTTTGMQFVTNGYVVNSGAGQSIALNGSAVVRVDSAATATINAVLSGGALNKDGDGTLVLAANNSYAGGTTITNGTLIVRNAAGLGLGTGPVTVLASPTTILRFENNASVGAVVITSEGSGPSGDAGFIEIVNASHADTATITNRGNTAAGGYGAFLRFDNAARGENATLENQGANFSSPLVPGFRGGGQTGFDGSSSADAAQITNSAGVASGLQGGRTIFGTSALAGTSTITNRGGQIAGAEGGLTQFFGSSNAEQATLIAEGGANGGLGGLIQFLNKSNGGTARVILGAGDVYPGTLDISALTSGGTTLGSIEGAGSIFLGGKGLSVGALNSSTVFSGSIADFGGAVGAAGGNFGKSGSGTLTLTGESSYGGFTFVFGGVLELRSGGRLPSTTPLSVSFGAEFQLFDATSTRASVVSNSGRVKFFDSAKGGTAAITNFPTTFQAFDIGSTVFAGSSNAENAILTNLGSTGFPIQGAATSFEGNASAGNATIYNQPSPVDAARIDLGSTSFAGAATAANAHIFNNAATTASGGGGVTEFNPGSSAGAATITSQGASVAGAATSGGVEFSGATAGTATFLNGGATVNGGKGGVVFFSGDGGSATFRNFPGAVNGALGGKLDVLGSSTGSAIVENLGATVAGAHAGTTLFELNASAGASTILNARSGSTTDDGGNTTFANTSLAGSATFTNEGARNSPNGFGSTVFMDMSNAGSGVSTNHAGQVASVFGGRTVFSDMAQAGSRQFINEGGATANGYAGDLFFFGSSNAANATIVNHGSTIAGANEGGVVLFNDNSLAGTATITNEGSAFAGSGLVTAGGLATSGGQAQFFGSAGADHATITNAAALQPGGGAGVSVFNGSAVTADHATITNQAASIDNANGGVTSFVNGATADHATIDNLAPSFASAYAGGGGGTFFFQNSTAGNATITTAGAVGLNSGLIVFTNTSNAAQSIIHNQGAVADGGIGGITFFEVGSNAGSSTLYAEAGIGNGGHIIFHNLSDGGTARAIIDGSGLNSGSLDVSGISDNTIGIGSIEGAGKVFLGSKNLSVGGNNLSTTFSGVVSDGGSLTKTGSGTFTLSGANTYTGGTTVQSGKLLAENTSGSATGSGGVIVKNGATLGGHGHIAGAVIVQPGGIFSPGASPGTLSVDSLTFEPDAILAIEIGGTTPGTQYDQVDVTGQLVLDGKLQISIIGGYVPHVGDTFHILQSGSLSGSFAAVESPNLGASMAVVASGLSKGGLLAVIELLPGDFNLDGHVNAADIRAMLTALTDVNQYKTMTGLSDSNLLTIGDINRSGAVTNGDMQALLDKLKSGGGSVDPVPEPTSIVLMALALPGLVFAFVRRRGSYSKCGRSRCQQATCDRCLAGSSTQAFYDSPIKPPFLTRHGDSHKPVPLTAQPKRAEESYLYAETPKGHNIPTNDVVDIRTLLAKIRAWLAYEVRPWEGCHVPELGSY